MTRELVLVLAAAFAITWSTPKEPAVVIGVYRDAGEEGWRLVGETPASSAQYQDTLVEAGKRYTYHLRARQATGAVWSGPSLPVGGAWIDLAPGPGDRDTTTSGSPGAGRGTQVLVVTKPAGTTWLMSWEPARPEIEGSENLWAWLVWDYNKNLRVDLQDLAVFSETEYTDAELGAFLGQYGRPCFFFFNIPQEGGQL